MPKKTLNIQKKKTEKTIPYKEVKIGGVKLMCLIDTGSDVNLITKTEFKRIKEVVQDCDYDASICLTGIAGREIYTEGVFVTKIQVDDDYAYIKLYIVEDDVISVNLIIGNPILKEFEVNFNANGVFMKKIPVFTFSIETNDTTEECNIEDLQYSKQIEKMVEDYYQNKEVKKSNVELRINKECIEKKIIKPSKSGFASSIVLAGETDGSHRVCIDYKGLNKKIIRERFPLPLTEEYGYVIEHRQGSKMKHADALSRYLVCLILTETTARLKKAQDEDEHVNLLKKILEKESRVYKQKNGARLIVVPKKMRNEIIRKNYGKGTFGIAKTEELIFGTKMKDNDDKLSKPIEEENVLMFNEKRHELREKAKESIKKIQAENVRSYNNKRKQAKSNDVGDLVAIKKTQFSQGSKLYPKFLGPYEIVRKNRNDRYVLKKIGNSEGPINTTSSADFMKPWIGCDGSGSSETDE